MPTSEATCVNLLASARQKYETTKDNNSLFIFASASLELALALPAAQIEEKRLALDEAKATFDRVHRKSRNVERRIHAGVISAYMDAFEARAFGRALTKETIQNTYRGLTRMIEEHDNLPKRDQVRTGGSEPSWRLTPYCFTQVIVIGSRGQR